MNLSALLSFLPGFGIFPRSPAGPLARFLQRASAVFLLCLASIAAPLAQAQTAKSRSALYTEIDTNLPSTTGAITAAILRAQLKNVVASAYNTVNADAQPIDADLTAIAALTTANYGRSLLTLADAAALRTTAALVIGTDVQAFDADLTAIAALSSNGLIARTGAGTAAARTLTGTAAEITVTNGDGASGNPTLSLPAALTFTGKTITGGTFASPTLTTPALGTPSAAVLTSATGLPLTTGVTGTLPVTNGGTGRATSTTAYGLLAAGTTATGAHQTLAAGLTTQVLVGGGASALPVWTTVTGTGSPVLAASPTLTTPTISSITAAAATDLSLAGGTAGTNAVKVTNTTPSTSTTSGAFQVAGGMSAQGAVYIGGSLNGAGGATLTGTSGSLLDLNITSGTANTIQQYQSVASTKAIVGLAGTVNSLINGSAVGDFTIRGNGQKILFSADSGTTAHLTIGTTGTVLAAAPTGGLGYGTGAGGAVTQITSRTTGVTLNKVSGAITLFTAAGSATAASFTVTNSAFAATDTVVLSVKSATNKYLAFVTAVAAGSFEITFYTTGGTTSDAPVINFAIFKAVTS